MKIRACCVSIDIKDSENLQNKDTLIIQIEEEIKIINKQYNSDLIIPLNIRRGDEIICATATFKTGYTIYRILQHFYEELNVKAYCGIGLGVIDTALDFKINFQEHSGKIINNFNNKYINSNIDTVNGSAIISAFRARDDVLKYKSYEKIIHTDNDKEFKLAEFARNMEIIKVNTHIEVFFYNNENKIPYDVINYLTYEVNKHWSNCSDLQKKAIRLIRQLRRSENFWNYNDLGIKLGYKNNPGQNARSVLKNAEYDLYLYKIQKVNSMLDYVETHYLY